MVVLYVRGTRRAITQGLRLICKIIVALHSLLEVHSTLIPLWATMLTHTAVLEAHSTLIPLWATMLTHTPAMEAHSTLIPLWAATLTHTPAMRISLTLNAGERISKTGTPYVIRNDNCSIVQSFIQRISDHQYRINKF